MGLAGLPIDLETHMPVSVVVAITHSKSDAGGPTLEQQVRLYSGQRVGLGTKIKGKAGGNVGGDAKRDLDLLQHLGDEGGIAVVTFEIGATRLLARIAAGTQPEAFDGLHALKIAAWKPLPESLRGINTIGRTIRELDPGEAKDAVGVARNLGLLDEGLSES